MKPRLCVSISAQDSNQRYTIMNAVGRVIVLIVLLICGATTAFAQAMPNPSIAVLDIQRILRESLAAKSVRPQADKIRGKYQKEVRNQESQLRKAEQDLARQRAILSPEAYAQKRRKFEERARTAQRSVQGRKRQLDKAFGGAMEKVRGALVKIAAKIASERKINLVLPKSVVLLSLKSLDITDQTLARLNKQLPSVKVTVARPK